jgi:predicted DNA-binding protein (MmcQ/YjbR family)
MKSRQAAFAALVARAMEYPEAYEDHPWGDTAIKVRGKMFLILRISEAALVTTVKLPASRYFALDYPGTRPTGHNLGKSGWITAEFAEGETVPMDLLHSWIDESYRAVAPKKLAATRPSLA